MVGNNTMQLNGATMRAAVQMYIDELFNGDAPRVAYVTELSEHNCFEIRLQSPIEENAEDTNDK